MGRSAGALECGSASYHPIAHSKAAPPLPRSKGASRIFMHRGQPQAHESYGRFPEEEENPSVSGVLGHDTLLSKKERFEEPTIYLHRAHRSTRSAVNPLLQTGTD